MEVKQEAEDNFIQEMKIEIKDEIIDNTWNEEQENQINFVTKFEFVTIKQENSCDYPQVDNLHETCIKPESNSYQIVDDPYKIRQIKDFKESSMTGETFNTKREEEMKAFDCSEENSKETEGTVLFKYVDYLHSDINEIVGKDQESNIEENLLECSPKKKPFKCGTCTKSFLRKDSLKVHMRIHTEEKPFRCEVCSEYFSKQNYLTEHWRIHSGEKPYKCEVCCKYFTNKSNLNNHQRLHTGEKPFKCAICFKCFPVNSKLTVHLRCHAEEKIFTCEICYKCFRTKSNLNSHKLLHTGDKPYQCAICCKRFSQNQNLKSHERRHIGEKPFGCEICSKYFTEKGTLKRHYLRVHAGEKMVS